MVDALHPHPQLTDLTFECIYPTSNGADAAVGTEDRPVSKYSAIRFTVQIKTEEARQIVEPLRRAEGMLLRFSEESSGHAPEDLVFQVSYIQPPKEGT